MNCFLNSALQLVWHLSLGRDGDHREAFTRFFRGNGLVTVGTKGPLFRAIVDLFEKAAHASDASTPQLDSVNIRRELFKLSYERDTFCLNSKGDAFEAFDFLLTAIHECLG